MLSTLPSYRNTSSSLATGSISLKEISTPISLVNMKKDTHMFQIKNVKTGHVVVQRSVLSNTYPNEISLIHELNRMISRTYDITFRWGTVQNNNRQIKICVRSDTYVIQLNKRLFFVLGFGLTERDYRKGDHAADGFIIMPPIGNIRNMFVYCDVVNTLSWVTSLLHYCTSYRFRWLI